MCVRVCQSKLTTFPCSSTELVPKKEEKTVYHLWILLQQHCEPFQNRPSGFSAKVQTLTFICRMTIRVIALRGILIFLFNSRDLF